MALKDMQKNRMMGRLIAALEKGEDVGHYGRLVFAMIARHFVDEDELVKLLAKQPEMDETQARALVLQVQGRDYNPPRREKILAWQQEQDFKLIDENDPDAGNVYRDLEFPEGVYENIQEYYEEKAER